ncbi:hypothetical protein WA026_012928 [Henosepilachna vigintioctopunctata]|uniref:Uncharacterized protein n=1 Tax=Henosepilachna vigintioctopunctata TaxID=420089 RepID=A0AAW1TUQ7_9CUCU
MGRSIKKCPGVSGFAALPSSVGAPAPGGQYAHYKEDLFLYGQRAFGMPPDRHYRMLHMAGEEKPPIVVLSVVVIEAEGLEAKDANGEFKPRKFQ